MTMSLPYRSPRVTSRNSASARSLTTQTYSLPSRSNTAVSGTPVMSRRSGISTLRLTVQAMPGAMSYFPTFCPSSVSATVMPAACVELWTYSLRRASNTTFG